MGTNILIIGGYGNAGFRIAELLLLHTECRIIIAGRNPEKAQNAVRRLAQFHAAERVSPMALDATDLTTLRAVLQKVTLVIVAASSVHLAPIIAQAAVETNTDYFDILLSSREKLQTLQSFEPAIQAKGLVFITDGGFHPGLPGAMVRRAAEFFDELISANVASAFKLDWRNLDFALDTAVDMVNEISRFKPTIFQNGQWVNSTWTKYKTIDFGEQGSRTCVPMHLLEMETLPQQISSLRNAGFHIAGFDPITDYLTLPLLMMWNKVAPSLGIKTRARLLLWSLKSHSKPPFFVTLLLQAFGLKDGKQQTYRLEIMHHDGYALTAIPAVITVIQYLQNRRPGLHFQADYLDPQTLNTRMQKMGIQWHEQFEQPKVG